MERPKSAAGLSRRDFLKWAGVGAVTLPLADSCLGGWLETPDGPFALPSPVDTHDLLSLPDWGPYSKKHFGISHIPDVRRGLCFDVSIFPLLTRGPGRIPSVTEKSGVHPWEAAAGLDYYSIRLETIPQDQLYSDLSFSRLSDDQRLVRLELVNQTSVPQEMTLHCLAQLVFPPAKELTAEPIRLCAAEVPGDGLWVHALDYTDLQFGKARPTDNLVTDGKWRGEERRHDAVDGAVVAAGFGLHAGDTIVYHLKLKRPMTNAVLAWRFQMKEGEQAVLQMTEPFRQEILFQGIGRFATVAVPLGPLKAGDCELRFTSPGGAAVALNGFAVLAAGLVDQLHFPGAPWHPLPEIQATPASLIFKYQDIANSYEVNLGLPLAGHRQLKWQDLDAAFGNASAPETKGRIFGDHRRGRAGDPDSLFIHAYSAPFTLAPNSRRVVYGVVGTGVDAGRRSTTAFDPLSPANDRVYQSARGQKCLPVATPAGEAFQFGQQLMAAVTLTSLVYPLNVQRNYIRHFSPGRIWDCVYTWDAGFIGLGLLEIDLPRAREILNAYTTPEGSQSAFIHHGSPVPVQIYLLCELWNRTQSRELLAYFYPRLRQYHRFLAGRLGSSTTRKHPDGLICTWDYFYNSGGWDDYPPQKFVHQQKLEAAAVPVINSAHTIRCAKMLRAIAAALGETADFAEYEADIATLSGALQKSSWDAAAGYFGYVLHDAEGAPSGILRDANGVNFNMGLDGVSPLVSGICRPEQEQVILEHLFSPQHLWMDIGITTVDQSAPYFIPTGYWNGSVWFAHQWFLWKTMLDLGRGELAVRIAQAGLKVWQRVTGATYDCMEHFMPTEPFGAGWHQFASLSSPVLAWFAALYTPGRLTCGFDVWIEKCRFGGECRRLQAKLKPVAGISGRSFHVLACMTPHGSYRVLWNGAPAVFTTVHDGLLQIQLPAGGGESGDLEVDVV